jgi:hypothetical protein
MEGGRDTCRCVTTCLSHQCGFLCVVTRRGCGPWKGSGGCCHDDVPSCRDGVGLWKGRKDGVGTKRWMEGRESHQHIMTRRTLHAVGAIRAVAFLFIALHFGYISQDVLLHLANFILVYQRNPCLSGQVFHHDLTSCES